MSKLIECDKCKELSNVFNSSHLIEESLGIKYILCEKCTDIFHLNLQSSRKQVINEFIQPERSKREDHHLSLDDFSDKPSPQQLAREMRNLEKKILDAVL